MNISPMISLSKTYWNRYFVGEISRTQKTNNHKDNKKQPHGRKKWWVCFFLCFLEVLFGFWPQVAKSLRRPQWSKKYRLGDYIRPNISLESFFFRVFLVFDQKWQNPRENQKTQKRTHRLGDYMRPETFPSNLCLLFLFFFGFLKIFATFGQKPKEPRENQKKQKKQKNKKKQRLGDYMRPDISLKSFFLFFLFFLVFSSFFWFLTKSSKILRRPNTTKIRTPYEARHFPQIFGLRECGREAGTRGLKAFSVLFGNLWRFLTFVRNYQLLLPWKHMKHMVRIEHSEKTNMM